jgi:hypothetical protein
MYEKPQLTILGTLRDVTQSLLPTGTTDSTFHSTPTTSVR